jgi:hypothetical protein
LLCRNASSSKIKTIKREKTENNNKKRKHKEKKQRTLIPYLRNSFYSNRKAARQPSQSHYTSRLKIVMKVITPNLPRKSIAIFFLTGLILFALFSWFTPSYATSSPNELTGEWRAKIQFKDGILEPYKDMEFMYSFNAGGTLTESSNHDSDPPVPPAYGIWRQTAPREFQIKYEYYATEAPADIATLLNGGGWKPSARGVLKENIKLSNDGKTYISQVRFDLFDLTGKPIAGGGTATAAGRKLTF